MGLREIGVSKLGSATEEGKPTQQPPAWSEREPMRAPPRPSEQQLEEVLRPAGSDVVHTGPESRQGVYVTG